MFLVDALLVLLAVAVFVLPWLLKKAYAVLLVYLLLMCTAVGATCYGGWKYDHDKEQRLAELGFTWDGDYDKMFANVAPENMAEATSLFNSQMGIGWQAKVMVTCIPLVLFSTIIYWLMTFCHWLVLKKKKNRNI
jgi:hypothetical protein